MRFRFRGDLDCPDWILAEINTISRMSSIKMKLLSQLVVGQILGTSAPLEKLQKLTADAKYELGDMKAAVAALSFIIISSVQHGVNEEILNSELQQLGLPREHSVALCRVYSENLPSLTEHQGFSSLRFSCLKNVACAAQFVGHNAVNSSEGPVFQEEAVLFLEKTVGNDGPIVAHQLCMTQPQLGLLISSLKKALDIMENV